MCSNRCIAHSRSSFGWNISCATHFSVKFLLHKVLWMQNAKYDGNFYRCKMQSMATSIDAKWIAHTYTYTYTYTINAKCKGWQLKYDIGHDEDNLIFATLITSPHVWYLKMLTKATVEMKIVIRCKWIDLCGLWPHLMYDSWLASKSCWQAELEMSKLK